MYRSTRIWLPEVEFMTESEFSAMKQRVIDAKERFNAVNRMALQVCRTYTPENVGLLAEVNIAYKDYQLLKAEYEYREAERRFFEADREYIALREALEKVSDEEGRCVQIYIRRRVWRKNPQDLKEREVYRNFRVKSLHDRRRMRELTAAKEELSARNIMLRDEMWRKGDRLSDLREEIL